MDSPQLLGAEHCGDNDGVLDWLAPLDVSPDFLQDVFAPPSPATPASARQHQDLGCDLVGEGNNKSMRTAFSLNDLTSLQSTLTTAPSWVHTRSISNRPVLETVPEGAPAALGCFPSQEYLAPPPLYPGSLGFIHGSPADESSVSASAFSGAEPSYPGGAGYCEVQQQVMMPPMAFGQPHSPPTMQQGPLPAVTSPPPQAAAAAKALTPAAPGRPVRTRRPTRQPPGFITDPSEQLMADPVKPEQVCDTDCSANAFAHAANNQAWLHSPTGPQPQASGPASMMRKSASALELGAWRKIAAGGMEFMDCIDPSGSVREQLHGLDAVQVGKLTPQERLQKILRYRAKRQLRNFNRTIKYQCRKSLADTRPRVRGRFARDNEPGSVLPHETKKALRTMAPVAPAAATLPKEKEAKAGAAAAAASPAGSGGLPRAGSLPAPSSPVPALPMVTGHGLVPAMPMAPSQAVQDAFLAVPGSPLLAPEQHSTAALAHLYNQWCEGPMDTPPMQG